jgi:hypothetical protein
MHMIKKVERIVLRLPAAAPPASVT